LATSAKATKKTPAKKVAPPAVDLAPPIPVEVFTVRSVSKNGGRVGTAKHEGEEAAHSAALSEARTYAGSAIIFNAAGDAVARYQYAGDGKVDEFDGAGRKVGTHLKQ
jgi:hypothetical protein